MTDEPADRAAELIETRIADYRRSMRHALSGIEPPEAVALLGYLFSDTLARFPSDQHDGLLDAFVDGFREPAGKDREATA